MSSSANSPRTSAINTVGERLRMARREQGMTQDDIAAPRFTKGYVSAVERGAVNPSLKALLFFAEKLGAPVSDFLVSTRDINTTPEIEFLEEDLTYRYNYAKMLLRDNQTDEALLMLAEAEAKIEPLAGKISLKAAYHLPFLRGLVHLKMEHGELAVDELTKALDMVTNKSVSEVGDAEFIVRNALGYAFYKAGDFHAALDEHLLCEQLIEHNLLQDPTRKTSFYKSLGDDYTALNNRGDAVRAYKKALALSDVTGPGQQADIFREQATSYNSAGNWALAKLYAARSLDIYEAEDDLQSVADMYIQLAESFIAESKYDSAKEVLSKGQTALRGTTNKSLESMLLKTFALLYLNQEEYGTASDYIGDSITLIKEALELFEKERRQDKGQKKYRTKAQAQGMSDKERSAQTTPFAWLRDYADALHVAARIEEERGNRDSADKFFKEAIDKAEQSCFNDSIYTIHYNYAEVLGKRGAYEAAAAHYRRAAQILPQVKTRATF